MKAAAQIAVDNDTVSDYVSDPDVALGKPSTRRSIPTSGRLRIAKPHALNI